MIREESDHNIKLLTKFAIAECLLPREREEGRIPRSKWRFANGKPLLLGHGMQETMSVVFVDLILMDVHQMRNSQGMIALWCGEYAHMPFTCNVSINGCLLRQNRNVRFVDNSGSSNQLHRDV